MDRLLVVRSSVVGVFFHVITMMFGSRFITASLDRLDCLSGDTTHAPGISLDDGRAMQRGSNYAAGTVVLRR